MAHVYFHCSSAGRMLATCCEGEIDGMADAREQAAIVVQSLLATSGPEDWRNWMLHVKDDLGEEILAVPFSSMIGRLH